MDASTSVSHILHTTRLVLSPLITGKEQDLDKEKGDEDRRFSSCSILFDVLALCC